MAGDWIKMRIDLRDDPEVFRLSTMLKLDRYSVVGRLHAFWSWWDEKARDGRVDGAVTAACDDVTATPGFGDAMLVVGWLGQDAGGLYLPNWERHNGRGAKERAQANQRQASHRARNAKSDGSVTPTSRSRDGRTVTREEKSSSSNKHPTVDRNRAVDNSPRSVQGGLTSSIAVPPQPPPVTPGTGDLKPPAAMTPAEREAHGIVPPPAWLADAAKKRPNGGAPLRVNGRNKPVEREPGEPTDDELLEDLRKPVTFGAAVKALDANPDTDWASTPDGIDRAGQLLGMKRLPFEEDDDFAKRIEARIALG